jgi:Spy/CpxP family protein refolding chaperone
MKAYLLTLPLLAIAYAAAAQEPTPKAPPPASAPSSNSPAELAALDRFLDLSDAELAQMADAIARLRAMTPEQRVALRKEITEFRQLPETQRSRIRAGWGWMPAEIQNGWREMMQAATPEKRASIQARLQSLAPEERTRYRRELVEEYLKAKVQKK